MKIYAIGDLHLSFARQVVPGNWGEVDEYKSMSLFGEKWFGHYQKIYENWLSLVNEEDLVLIPGDISWASSVEELKYDLDYLKLLPGKKNFVKGNHDYWWQSIKKLRAIMPENFYLIQNDSFKFDEILIAGSRGWTVPDSNGFSEHDSKIYQREVIRLGLSLQDMKKKMTGRPEEYQKIVMLHYMPVNEDHERNEMIDLLQEFQIDICLYGHLHGKESQQISLNGEKWGIKFKLVSSDYLNFIPEQIG